MLCALIMAGGKGTRFWPLSTEKKTKQFLNLIGEETMIQMTVNRIKEIIPMDRIFVCTGESYVSLVKEQLPELLDRNIIVEPEGRNTTPCIALSALVIKRYFKDANMVVLPSDHLIKNEDKFREIIKSADKYVRQNKNAIITLGMNPSRPETGYGYIKYGKEEQVVNDSKVIKVEAFVEKPNKEIADEYLSQGNYIWNGGMFLWSIENIINQIKEYSQDTFEALKDIDNIEEKQLQKFINNNYKNTDAISIDYAVLEKSDDIYVIPSDIDWDDIGTWAAVERYKKRDELDNIVTENVCIIESKSNIVINNNKKLVMIGIEGIMAVETEDSMFIVNKKYINSLKNYQYIF